MSVNDGSGAFWQEGDPAGSAVAGGGALEIRDLRTGVRLRLKKEHVEPADGTVGGEHKNGSAKVYYVPATPTKRPDGTTDLDATDYGRLWVDANDLLYIYNIDGTFHQLYGKTFPASVVAAMIANDTITPRQQDVGSKVNVQQFVGGTAGRVLTFGFDPTVVVILARGGTNVPEICFAFQGDTGMSVLGASAVFSPILFGSGNLTLTSVSGHFNGAGITYTVIAFG